MIIGPVACCWEKKCRLNDAQVSKVSDMLIVVDVYCCLFDHHGGLGCGQFVLMTNTLYTY